MAVDAPHRLAFVACDGNATLPADYLSHRRVTWTGSPRVELQYVHPSYLQAAYPSAPADVPRIFTIEGSTLKVRPLDSTALEVNYFQKIPPLATNDPNWLLTLAPDLYLYGALLESAPYIKEDGRIQTWALGFSSALNELNNLGPTSTFNAGPVTVHVSGQVI